MAGAAMTSVLTAYIEWESVASLIYGTIIDSASLGIVTKQ